MGYKRDWDMNAIQHGIWMMRAECTNPRNDGFVTWGTKQELYRLKWLIDESLDACSTYVDEQEWLKEQEQQKVIRILKDE
jgi:hypothetical protein